MSPSSVESSPRIAAKSVDLPDPLGPTSPIISPSEVVRLTFYINSYASNQAHILKSKHWEAVLS